MLLNWNKLGRQQRRRDAGQAARARIRRPGLSRNGGLALCSARSAHKTAATKTQRRQSLPNGSSVGLRFSVIELAVPISCTRRDDRSRTFVQSKFEYVLVLKRARPISPRDESTKSRCAAVVGLFIARHYGKVHVPRWIFSRIGIDGIPTCRSFRRIQP